jgi:hypothetical protein
MKTGMGNDTKVVRVAVAAALPASGWPFLPARFTTHWRQIPCVLRLPSHPRTAVCAAPVAFTPSARPVGFSERDSDQVLETSSVPRGIFYRLGL